MARIEQKVKTQAEMKDLLGSILASEDDIKKIDVRSLAGGYKLIVKTIDKQPIIEEESQDGEKS